MTGLRRAAMRWALVGACALVASASFTSAASAQEGPYGSTSTSSPPPRVATLRLTVDAGPRGSQVGVFACGYAPGSTDGSVSFDGSVVASGLIANADGCLTADGSPGPTGAPLTIRVPDDARPGQRNVCSVLAGYNTPCAKFQVQNGNGQGQGDTEVQGATVTRESGGQRGSGGSLARTGLALGAFVAAAAALLVVGRALLSRSRRLRRSRLI